MSKPPVRPAPKPVTPPVRPPVTPPVRPPVMPPVVRPPVVRPPVVRPPVTPPRPGPIRADDTGRVPPSERKPTTPAIQKNMTPPQYVPMGPSKPAVSGGNMAKAAVNAGMPSRGGTPVTVRDAPGYRGSGTQPMPSSQPRGFSKGGSASKRADGIAIRGKTRA